MGLREQKKDRTRRVLVRTALSLFDEYGYEAVTVARVAAAAEVSEATLFNYFPAKEDLVFPDRNTHATLFAEVLERRSPGDGPRELLAQGIESLLRSTAWTIEPTDPLAAARGRVIAASPALRARSLVEVAELQQQWAVMLARACPDTLDETDATALTGAMFGAIIAVITHTLRRGDAPPDLPELVRQAAGITAPPAAPH